MTLTSPGSTAPLRGRPKKFTSPSRQVTLTLPDNVLVALEAIDPDLSRAVVRVMQPEMAKPPRPPAELSRFGRYAVIVVNPTRMLERSTGVQLVPLSDGRALIAFDDTLTIPRLALAIQDQLDDHALPDEDARIFQAVRTLLTDARRTKSVVVRQRNIILIEYGRHQARARRTSPHSAKRSVANAATSSRRTVRAEGAPRCGGNR